MSELPTASNAVRIRVRQEVSVASPCDGRASRRNMSSLRVAQSCGVRGPQTNAASARAGTSLSRAMPRRPWGTSAPVWPHP